MFRRTKSRPALIAFAALIVTVSFMPGAWAAPPTVYLDEILFAHKQTAIDYDKDGLKDNLENTLAEYI